jgi:hypothetical protein
MWRVTGVGNTRFKQKSAEMFDARTAVLKEEVMEQRSKDHDSDGEAERSPIARPTTVDPDWDVKIRRAREAWEAGRRFRKDQPASPPSLLDL